MVGQGEDPVRIPCINKVAHSTRPGQQAWSTDLVNWCPNTQCTTYIYILYVCIVCNYVRMDPYIHGLDNLTVSSRFRLRLQNCRLTPEFRAPWLLLLSQCSISYAAMCCMRRDVISAAVSSTSIYLLTQVSN